MVQPGIVEGLARGGKRERHGARDVTPIFRLQLALPVEAAHLARYLNGRAGRVEALYAPHAADTVL